MMYGGEVRLRSPDGRQVVKIQVPGRRSIAWEESRGDKEGRGQTRRQDKRFRRLLSQGWTVVQPEEEGTVGEEEKKNTSVVVGTTKSGDKTHGGDHASGEVENSPNALRSPPRGCRGGEKKPYQRQNTPFAQERRLSQGQKFKFLQKRGGAGVYAPEPLRVGESMRKSAEQSAELLAALVGRAGIKVRRGVTVKTEALLVALELGDNPLPALEWPSERPKCRVLITPDCSGSTQGWNGLGQAWALALAKNPEIEVVYTTNINGDFCNTDKRLSEVDIVFYLGDGDGLSLCRSYAHQGATVVGLDCYAAHVAKPRLKTERFGRGQLFWVDRVSNRTPTTWADALRLAMKELQ